MSRWRDLWLRFTDIPKPALPSDGEHQEVRLEPQENIDPILKLGSGIVLAGFFAFLLWAALAPIDEGVPAQGMVMVDTKRKTIQHLTGGLVSKVHVREGSLVQAGDVLIKLDEGQAKADFEGIRQRYLSLRAMEDRLAAEQAGLETIAFHPDVLAGKDEPLINQHMRTQESLFRSRKLALKSELDSIRESVQAQQEAAKGYAAQLQARQEQMGYLKEELAGLRGFVAEGYAPRNKLLEMERMSADLAATLSELQAELARTKRSAAELSLRLVLREQEFRKEVDTNLADIRREVSADEERFRAARDALERTEIRAPVSGSVTGLMVQTLGAVISPGARVMDIVPHDELLMLEAKVPPHLIDRVKVGQVADIHFTTFSRTPQLVVEGELISVSADLVSDPETEFSYYLARIRITPEGAKTLGDRNLQPGMPAEVMIKTGERSLLEYLLHPLSRRLAQAMTEE